MGWAGHQVTLSFVIMWSHQLCFGLKLGCDNLQTCKLSQPNFNVLCSLTKLLLKLTWVLRILFDCRQAEWTITTWSAVPQLPPQTVLAELLETVASSPNFDGMFQAVMWDGLGKGRLII